MEWNSHSSGQLDHSPGPRLARSSDPRPRPQDGPGPARCAAPDRLNDVPGAYPPIAVTTIAARRRDALDTAYEKALSKVRAIRPVAIARIENAVWRVHRVDWKGDC